MIAVPGLDLFDASGNCWDSSWHGPRATEKMEDGWGLLLERFLQNPTSSKYGCFLTNLTESGLSVQPSTVFQDKHKPPKVRAL
jgi:hypothetical protein